MHDERGVKRVKLPVRMVDGHWELVYGGGIPVHEGTYAELEVALHAIGDEAFRNRVTREVVVKVFDEGRTLLVALSDHEWKGQLYSGHKVAPEDIPAGCTRFEQIKIGPVSTATKKLDEDRGGLWMRQVGVGRCELVCSSVTMPEGCGKDPATSLNHALTRLSEQHETHRISHTGSVYERVFYQESNGTWYPLALLRDGVVADAEHKIIEEAWTTLEQLLGWRPIPAPPANTRRR